MAMGNEVLNFFVSDFSSSGPLARINADSLLITPSDNLIGGVNLTAGIGAGQKFQISSQGQELDLTSNIAQMKIICGNLHFLTVGTITIEDLNTFVTKTLFDANDNVNADVIAMPNVTHGSGDAGFSGQMSFDPNFLYICMSSGTWARIPLTFFY